MMAALLRTFDLYGAGTLEPHFQALSLLSIQPHLYVYLLSRMSNTTHLRLCCSWTRGSCFMGQAHSSGPQHPQHPF